ncbi:MAG: hypothetical protein K0U54_09265, partial [Bacteroidetes bacterium]|nr:hypothetical protein [Bacteroidota bacterium]
MRQLITYLAITVLSIGGLLAQENRTVTQVKTVKRVVTKEGSKVTVKEVETVEGEEGAVVVAGNEEENQTFSEATEKIDQENVLVDETNLDENNEPLIAAEKKRQEEELKNSMETAKAKAEAQRQLLAQKEKERMEAVKANKKR